MASITPSQEWWTAEQIAAACLPDLPPTRQGVEALIKRMEWRAQPSMSRRRQGRGGGWEYSWALFPDRAKRKLLATVVKTAPEPVSRMTRDDAWRMFEALPAEVQDKARARLATIQKMEALERVMTRFAAANEISAMDGIAPRTLWSWLALVEGVRADDRLPYLAPRHRAADRSRSKSASPEFFALLKSDYLRNEQPSFTSCYRRALRVAAAKGWDVLPERTMRRHLESTVSEVTIILARKGLDAVKNMYPPQVRDKTALVALEAVNADFHKFDVFVEWPRPPGQNEPGLIGRPQMVAFQDIHSGRILAWRVDQTANSTAVMLCAGDMIATWGIPKHVLLDNGREFAAKAITGGAKTRFRFQVREDDIPGLFTALGCEIHWATPYSGQSKPIERAFRDMCDSIAKDPRLAGAYTGNKKDAQPENYGSRAIPLAEFLAVLGEGIEEHNTRQGRRSEVAWGRSFAEVFDESYATADIRKATEAQRRLWLLGAEGVRADSKTGGIKFQGNEFWADWMHGIAGQRVILRFDPADFWSGLHIYSHDNAYLGHAPCLVKAGFLDADEARTHQRARNAWLAAEKAAVKAHKVFRTADIGKMLDEVAPAAPVSPEAKVVRPLFGKPTGKTTAPTVPKAPQVSAKVADLLARRGEEPAVEQPRERFRRALELERGGQMTVEQERWLSVYKTTPEYRTERMLWEAQGDAIFG